MLAEPEVDGLPLLPPSLPLLLPQQTTPALSGRLLKAQPAAVLSPAPLLLLVAVLPARLVQHSSCHLQRYKAAGSTCRKNTAQEAAALPFCSTAWTADTHKPQ